MAATARAYAPFTLCFRVDTLSCVDACSPQHPFERPTCRVDLTPLANPFTCCVFG